MMDEKTIKAVMAYLEDQDEVRDRLKKIYREIKKPNFTKIAWSIDISPLTFSAFLRGNRNVELRILWAIDCWVREQESLRTQ